MTEKYTLRKIYNSQAGGEVIYVGFDKKVNKHAFLLANLTHCHNINNLFYEGLNKQGTTKGKFLGKISEYN